MATEKLTQLPNYTTPNSSSDILPIVDVTNTTTKKITLANLLAYLFTQTNIPAGGGSPVTRQSEAMNDYVVQNTGVWSGDAYASTRNASMTALTCYINGRRITIGSVTARTFTASKDTYIDVLDNGDGTGTLVYTEVTNNAASPALASNSLRIGIIVTGATTIAAAGSVNQGQETKILPIASSVAYTVTDSLGNLICTRDPDRQLLGFRISNTSFVNNSGAYVDITGLATCPTILPLGRKVKVTAHTGQAFNAADGGGIAMNVYDVTGSVQLDEDQNTSPGGNFAQGLAPFAIFTPSSSARVFKTQMKGIGTVTNVQMNNSGSSPIIIMVELE